LAKELLEGDEMHLECLHIGIGYLGTHFEKQKMLGQSNQMFYQNFGKMLAKSISQIDEGLW